MNLKSCLFVFSAFYNYYLPEQALFVVSVFIFLFFTFQHQEAGLKFEQFIVFESKCGLHSVYRLMHHM